MKTPTINAETLLRIRLSNQKVYKTRMTEACENVLKFFAGFVLLSVVAYLIINGFGAWVEAGL
jgi:hypothetical protein